ncbi:MAG: sulfatase family protein, partial [Planctomycetota bacterium]
MKLSTLIVALLLIFAITTPTPAADKPNIVIILADDLGWNDVGFHGSPIQTPNIDRIAAEGVQLNRFYVCPVCSPTRAGLMTG